MTPVPKQWWTTRWFIALVIVLSAVPLLWPTIPPLTDLPGHIGRYRVMLGTDAATLDAWYRFAWRPIGYLGVDLSVAALAPLLGLEPATKLIVILIPVLTVTGILWLSKEAHGRVQPTVLFALPYAYNLAFLYGFANYTLAMALALNAFALWLRMGRGDWRVRAAVFVPLACVIWTAHLFGWLCLGVVIFSAEVARQRAAAHGWPQAMLRAGIACLPLALPVLMFLGWHPGSGGASDWLESLRLKPGWLVMVLRDRWQIFDVACAILIALLLHRAFRDARVKSAPMLLAAAIGMLALFVAMPFGAAYADMRIAPYVIILALLSIRIGPKISGRERRLVAAIGLAFFLVRTAATTASFAIESADWDRHLAALNHVPRGARVVAFVANSCDQPWRMARSGHLPGMAIARRAAFSNDQFDAESGTALMTVTAPGIAGFAHDPSQIVMDAPCPQSPEFRTLDQALTQLPRDRFDMVWLITPPPGFATRTAGLRPVWSDGRDFLFAIPHRGLSQPQPAP
ncbi:glycosyltransferase family protein [Sphingomonas immobilis]|uniref:Glycosyltransferase RgtA/B/C/D-like domain-containing protein n=1 Tax=Sphingomonas immobilis TaxID=3063997 RepID=A0ABT8ZWC5_9SPHN|nr:hypothetical protein [Sphingomonas sp. CA1-15]MDO7841517.1 hypothetical protein [Sphingomonas sp. CA1-15]